MVASGHGFEEEFRASYRAAFDMAYRILGSVEHAEDAAAEGMARALVAWPKIRALPYRTAWILRVTSNVAIDAARRRRPLPVEAGWSTDAVDDAVLRVALVAALQALPRRQREVIVLRYLAGLPEREVAACLSISTNSVKTHGSRALSRLRSSLGAGWEKPDLAV